MNDLVVVPAKELKKLIQNSVREAISKTITPLQPPKQNEGDVSFALEILKEKAGLESLPTLYKWSHEGRVPCGKRGKKLWFHREQLESWIEAGMPHYGKQKAANRLAEINQ